MKSAVFLQRGNCIARYLYLSVVKIWAISTIQNAEGGGGIYKRYHHSFTKKDESLVLFPFSIPLEQQANQTFWACDIIYGRRQSIYTDLHSIKEIGRIRSVHRSFKMSFLRNGRCQIRKCRFQEKKWNLIQKVFHPKNCK